MMKYLNKFDKINENNIDIKTKCILLYMIEEEKVN